MKLKIFTTILCKIGFLLPCLAQLAPADYYEIKMYVNNAKIPKDEPFDCPLLEQQVDSDQWAYTLTSRVIYELITFSSVDETREGAEGNSEENLVGWKIINNSNTFFEVVIQTKNFKLGKRISEHFELQSTQGCMTWDLIINSSEIEAFEEQTITKATEQPNNNNYEIERTDPYAIEETGNMEEKNPNDSQPSYPTSYGLVESNPLFGIEDNIEVENQEAVVVTNTRERFSALLPPASSELNLPASFFTRAETLGDVEKIINNTLDAQGYSNRGYFEFDKGFMIATQMEHINSNGTSKAVEYRYPTRITFNQSLSFENYLSSLYMPESGLFRMFVFYIEAMPKDYYSDFNEIDYRLNANSQISTNVNRLPEYLANLPYRSRNVEESNITVLVYECQTSSGERRPKLLTNNTFTAREHLVKSRLWNLFAQP